MACDGVGVQGGSGFRALVFTGKQTREKLVWHGPFVCADKQQLMGCFSQVSGNGPAAVPAGRRPPPFAEASVCCSAVYRLGPPRRHGVGSVSSPSVSVRPASVAPARFPLRKGLSGGRYQEGARQEISHPSFIKVSSSRAPSTFELRDDCSNAGLHDSNDGEEFLGSSECIGVIILYFGILSIIG